MGKTLSKLENKNTAKGVASDTQQNIKRKAPKWLVKTAEIAGEFGDGVLGLIYAILLLVATVAMGSPVLTQISFVFPVLYSMGGILVVVLSGTIPGFKTMFQLQQASNDARDEKRSEDSVELLENLAPKWRTFLMLKGIDAIAVAAMLVSIGLSVAATVKNSEYLSGIAEFLSLGAIAAIGLIQTGQHVFWLGRLEKKQENITKADDERIKKEHDLSEAVFKMSKSNNLTIQPYHSTILYLKNDMVYRLLFNEDMEPIYFLTSSERAILLFNCFTKKDLLLGFVKKFDKVDVLNSLLLESQNKNLQLLATEIENGESLESLLVSEAGNLLASNQTTGFHFFAAPESSVPRESFPAAEPPKPADTNAPVSQLPSPVF